MAKKKKIGLVLSGGGTRGFAHVGALKVLDKLGIEYDAVAGCSIGSLIGACVCAGRKPEEIEAFIKKLNLFSLADLSWSSSGFIKGKKLETALHPLIQATTFRELKKPLFVNAVELERHREIIFSQGELWPALRASIAVPGVFVPEVIKGKRYLDGSLLSPVPISILPKDINTFIIVDVSHDHRFDNPNYNLLDYLNISVQLMMHKIVEDDLRSLRSTDFVYISPDLTGQQLFSKNKTYKSIIDAGETAARKKKKQILSLCS